MSSYLINFQFGIAILTGVVVFVAMAYDLRWRRIPNLITLPAILLGLTMHTLSAGQYGFSISLLGLIAGGGVLFIFYLMGGIGAGDVKLMGGVGALLGADKAVTALILTAFVGGLMAIFKILINTSLKRRLNYSVVDNSRKDRIIIGNDNLDPRRDTIPYGIAIGIGTLITLTF